MRYSVYIDGKENGSMTMEKEELYTRISANCGMHEGIVRLYVFGDGKRALLGVLSPRDGRLCLEKRFSKNEMRRFPDKIEYAANSEIETLPIPSAEEEAIDDGLLWFQTPDGNLTAFDGEKSLIAVPTDKMPPSGRVLNMDGKKYLIFGLKRNFQ